MYACVATGFIVKLAFCVLQVGMIGISSEEMPKKTESRCFLDLLVIGTIRQ